MAEIEYRTLYSELTYSRFNSNNLKFQAMRHFDVRIPLTAGVAIDEYGQTTRAAFTCDVEARDVMRSFEDAVGRNSTKLAAASLIEAGGANQLLKLINNPSSELTDDDIVMLKRAFLAAYSSQKHPEIYRIWRMYYFQDMLTRVEPHELGQWISPDYRLEANQHPELSEMIEDRWQRSVSSEIMHPGDIHPSADETLSLMVTP